MFLNSCRVCIHLTCEIGESAVVSVGERGDAGGEGLRDAIHLATDRSLDRRDPSVIDDELADLVLGECRVVGDSMTFEGFLGVFDWSQKWSKPRTFSADALALDLNIRLNRKVRYHYSAFCKVGQGSIGYSEYH